MTSRTSSRISIEQAKIMAQRSPCWRNALERAGMLGQPAKVSNAQQKADAILRNPTGRDEKLELLFLALLKRHGSDLPTPEREFRFDPDRRFRFDVCWPLLRLAIEIDGGIGFGRHTRPQGFDRDCEKINIAILRGYRVLRFSGAMLKRDPVGCVEVVRKAIGTGSSTCC